MLGMFRLDKEGYRKHEDGSLRGFIAIRQKDGGLTEASFLFHPVEE